MPNIVTMTGTFRGKATDWGVSLTSKSEVPQFVLEVFLTEYWDEQEQEWQDYTEQNEGITAYLVMISGEGKILKNTEQIMKVFGWNGESFTVLAEMDLEGTEFQVRIGENDYEGAACPYKVEWLDEYDAVPGRAVQKLDAKGLKDLDKAFGAKLKKAAGPTKAKSAPPKSPKSKTVIDTETVDKGDNSAESKMERNRAEKAKSDAAKAKREERKAKLEAEKAAAAEKARAKAKTPKAMPAISKKEVEPVEVDMIELTKEEAWERVCETQEQVECDDDAVNAAFISACQLIGDTDEPDIDTFTDAQWGQVAEIAIQTLVGV